MMKKMFFTGSLMVLAMTASAQNAFEGNKLTDNWYIGVNLGGVTPTVHSAFWKNMRGLGGIELGKQITPVLGLSVQGLASVNTSYSRTAFGAMSLTANGKINLNNLFGGYQGVPRTFEVEAIAGFGWGHDFMNKSYGLDDNYLVNRYGASFNFNLGENKAWTINVKPSIIYRMGGSNAHQLNINRSAIELLAGLTYHFGSSNSEHYMTNVKPYDAAEIAALNNKVNALRQDNAAKDKALADNQNEINSLKKQLADCQNAGPKIQTNTIVKNSMSLESVVTFRQGKVTIDPAQTPNVERIATYMKNHPESRVDIKGYASPEGSVEINARIARQRAEAVKTMLINKYNINANRISAEGQGVGNMFSEPDWNRVSIATLNEEK